jgi:predicted enzyme related to lactoylglutathione lyase
MAITRIAYFVYFVTDMDRAVQFYTEVLGLPVEANRGAWVQFKVEGGTFALHQSEEGAGNNAAESGGIVGFAVDDIDAYAALLKEKNVAFHGEIRQERFGKLLNILDPDGNIINLYEPALVSHGSH